MVLGVDIDCSGTFLLGDIDPFKTRQQNMSFDVLEGFSYMFSLADILIKGYHLLTLETKPALIWVCPLLFLGSLGIPTNYV